MATVSFSPAGKVLYAYLAGEIDHDAAQSLRIQLDDALVSRTPQTMILDFGGVGFMDSSVVGELRPAPKIFKDTCRIDWNRPVKRIYDFIRGLSPYPAAWTELVQPGGESVVVKIFETEKIGESHQLAPGTLQTDGKTYIRVAAEDGFVGICSLQLPGKKRLKTDELLRGFRLTEEYVMK